MSRVTSYQPLVIGRSFEHCLTVLGLQNFFTNTISLKLGTYMNFISFQYLKTLVLGARTKEQWEKWRLVRSRKAPNCKGFSLSLSRVFVGATTRENGVPCSQVPLKVPHWLHVNSRLYTVKSASSEAARVAVPDESLLLCQRLPVGLVRHFQHLRGASVLLLRSSS